MSNLQPDTLPRKAHADKTAGPAPKIVNIGHGLGGDEYDPDYFSAFDENGVDTAHLIAHFPTGFKNKIWEQLVIYHIYTFMWFVKTE